MTTWPDKGEHRCFDERVGNDQKKKENKETEEDEETEGCEFKEIKEVFIMA